MASVERKRKRQEWGNRFSRYCISGLTVAKICAQERVSINSFYYWARRVGDTATYERGKRVSLSTFAPLAPVGLGRAPRVLAATALASRASHIRTTEGLLGSDV